MSELLRNDSVVSAPGVLGKPSAAHALALLKELLDAPEARKPDDGKHAAPEMAPDAERGNDAPDAKHQEDPPRACAEMILGLNHDGVEHTYDYEGTQSGQGACNEIGRASCRERE